MLAVLYLLLLTGFSSSQQERTANVDIFAVEIRG